MCKNIISNKNAFCIYWHRRTCVCLKVEHKKIASFYNWFMPLDKSAFVSDHCVNIFKLVYFKRCNFQINDISFEPTCIIVSQCYKMFNFRHFKKRIILCTFWPFNCNLDNWFKNIFRNPFNWRLSDLKCQFVGTYFFKIY